MTFAMARIYRGVVAEQTESLNKGIRQQLLPQLLGAAGLLRYTLVRLHDGGVGSVSLYTDREAAARGRGIAAEWAGRADVMHAHRTAERIEGDICAALDGSGDIEAGALGMLRVYHTNATRHQIEIALEAEARHELTSIPGFLGGLFVKLSDERCVALTACKDRNAEQLVLERVRAMRSAIGSKIARAFPRYPDQTIKTTILQVYIPDPISASGGSGRAASSGFSERPTL